MFVDFNKVFNDKPQTQMELPQPLVDYMSRSLPEGIKYVADENGNCVITSESGSFEMGGFRFRPTKKQLEILGEDYTRQDVLNYFYNSQKAIPLTLDKEGYILLNGEEIPIEKTSINPHMPVAKDNTKTSYWLIPSKFPEAFPIKIGSDKYEREIFVSRVPNESVNIMAFESGCDEPLKVRYFLNEYEKSITMNLSLNLIRASTVLDLVQVTSIYNAFIDGKGTLLGCPFGAVSKGNSANKFDEGSICFWEKVLEIERILKVQFYPPENNVASEDIYLVEQLYQSLVKKIPTRDKQIINSLNGKWNPKKLGFDINDMIGKPMFIRFDCTSHIELFGIKKDLPTLVGIVNAVLEEYKMDGEKQEVTLADESQEKKRFNSIMFFESVEEMSKFIDGDHQEIIEMFQNAKRPSEYV